MEVEETALYQIFMWLVAHDPSLTKYRMSRCGFSISATCSSCGNEDEVVLHVLVLLPLKYGLDLYLHI